MGITKNPTTTIWESASRPLIVRSVWLESSKLRPKLQRHFLLDFVEPNRSLSALKLINQSLVRQRKENLNRLLPTGYTDLEYLHTCCESEDDFVLIDTAKAKLHEPFKTLTNKATSWPKEKYRKRWPLLRQKVSSSSYSKGRRNNEIREIISRRSSLQDFPEKQITVDECLAERVLNWLDLAKKSDYLPYAKCRKIREMEKIYNNNNNNKRDSCQQKPKNGRDIHFSARRERSKAVKQITIIFNREGRPVRVDPLMRNIELCTLSQNPRITKRLTSTSASARLYQSTHGTTCVKSTIPTMRRRLDTVADLATNQLQRRLQEDYQISLTQVAAMPGNGKRCRETKKQLHVFMPSLSKKVVSNVSQCGSPEDGISELSHNFSQICNI
uniref:Uncharacterized protein n=1 Tax=Glossina pallidipes TaxID=7398 RepID=A0A1A9ZPI6_GLOPL